MEESTPAVTPARRTRGQTPRRATLAHPDGGAALDPTWLAAAVEHAADAIVVTDLDGTIRYVNAAFERMSERDRTELLGQRTTSLGTEQSATYRAMAAAVRRGQVWQGELLQRRRDGSPLYLAATVAPIRDAAGHPIGAVAVQRDVSPERSLAEQLALLQQERAEVATALHALRAGATPEATALAIVTAVAQLPGLRGAGLWSLDPDGRATGLAAVLAGHALPMLGPLPAARVAELRQGARRGPWLEAWHPRAGHPYAALLAAERTRQLAYLPVRADVDPIALLVAVGEDGGVGLADRLPALTVIAAVAGALLGPALRMRGRQALVAARIGAILETGAFVPVFQPIVQLRTRTLVGCEALTRFADGSAPERVFADAQRCGLSLALETATLRAAMAAARELPASAWLNLNVSPEVVLAGDALASVLHEARASVVLELTEHLRITDYAALRTALERLGPGVRLAVDDAGAGFASFRHILELRPDYVKLDRSLVHAIGRDPARQALVAGLVHFGARTGATLIAEGVESEAEARALDQLGVPFAQGYHLGRPAPAGHLARRAGVGTVPRGRPPRSRRPARDDEIGAAVNIGATLAAALRAVGITTLAEPQALGAVPVWERLAQSQPRLATRSTLLKLAGASRGVRPAGLLPEERDRLKTLVAPGRREAETRTG